VGRVAFFIDGGYLDRVLRDEFNGVRINYQRFGEAVLGELHPDAQLLRAYYYHCLPYQSNPATPDESRRFAAQQNFFDAMKRIPRFEVRLGKLARRGPDQQGKYWFEQKMVDVLLSVDMVLLSAKKQVTDIVLLTGDSDVLPAVIL